MHEIRYVSAILLTEADKLKRVQVMRTGTFYHSLYGKFSITTVDLDTMVRNFREYRPKLPTELVVDYEHQSGSGQIAPAAGWVKGLERDGDALYAAVAWTGEAVKRIQAKEYRFISPEFNMHYKHKESGKDIGPTLLAVALTNRPFLEGMEPVMLVELGEWTQAYIDDLPNSAFAYVEPGKVDGSGRTVPRSLRHLPYKDKNGVIDSDHLRNALARLEQTDLPPHAKAKAKAVLDKAAQEAGVGKDESGQKTGEPNTGKQKTKEEESKRMEEQLRKLLGLGPEDDLIAAIKDLIAKAGKSETDAALTEQGKTLTETKKQLEAANVKLAEQGKVLAEHEKQAVEADVTKALSEKRILPKQVDSMRNFRAKDPEGFKAFIASAPRIGPDSRIIGSDGDSEAIQLTEKEREIGHRMGLTDADLIEQKNRDAEAVKR